MLFHEEDFFIFNILNKHKITFNKRNNNNEITLFNVPMKNFDKWVNLLVIR